MENDIIAFSSQASPRKRNPDGTLNVYCSRCHRFIAVAGEREAFASAECVICTASDNGIALSQEEEDQIQMVKMPDGRMLSLAAVAPKTIIPDPLIGENKEIGRIGYFFKAVSKLKAVAKALGALAEVESKKIARSKRKKPVLEGGLEINLQVNKKE